MTRFVLLLCLLSTVTFAAEKKGWMIATGDAVYSFKRPMNYPDGSTLSDLIQNAAKYGVEPFTYVAEHSEYTWIRAIVETADSLYRGDLYGLAAISGMDTLGCEQIVAAPGVPESPLYHLRPGLRWSKTLIQSKNGERYHIWCAFPRRASIDSVIIRNP